MRRALSPFVPPNLRVEQGGPPQQSELLELLDDCTTSRRVATACTECRSRKCKCDGNPEGCQSCLEHDRECVFVAVTFEENQMARQKKRYPDNSRRQAKRAAAREDRPRPPKRPNLVISTEPAVSIIPMRSLRSSYTESKNPSTSEPSPCSPQAPPSPRSQSPPPLRREAPQETNKAATALPVYPSPYPAGPTPLLFPYTPLPVAAFDFYQMEFQPQSTWSAPPPLLHSPTNLLQSPPRFPLTLPPVSGHAPQCQCTPSPYLPTPRSNPVSPLLASPPTSYFSTVPSSLAQTGLPFIPSSKPQVHLSPEEVAQEEERRAMEGWILGVGVDEEQEIPSMFAEGVKLEEV